jgi:hypothetical protein
VSKSPTVIEALSISGFSFLSFAWHTLQFCCLVHAYLELLHLISELTHHFHYTKFLSASAIFILKSTLSNINNNFCLFD